MMRLTITFQSSIIRLQVILYSLQWVTQSTIKQRVIAASLAEWSVGDLEMDQEMSSMLKENMKRIGQGIILNKWIIA